MKIKIFCEEQLDEAIAKCVAEATEYCKDLDGADCDADFVNMVITSMLTDRYYLTDDVKKIVGEDDALCIDFNEIIESLDVN